MDTILVEDWDIVIFMYIIKKYSKPYSMSFYSTL